MSKFNRTLS